jgi:hypothetical protein
MYSIAGDAQRIKVKKVWRAENIGKKKRFLVKLGIGSTY